MALLEVLIQDHVSCACQLQPQAALRARLRPKSPRSPVLFQEPNMAPVKMCVDDTGTPKMIERKFLN